MLCSVCSRGLDLDEACLCEGTLHHTRCADLQAAADDGCHLCVEIWRKIKEDEDYLYQFVSGGSQIKLSISSEGYLACSLDPSGNELFYRARFGVFYITYAAKAIVDATKYTVYRALHYYAGSESFFELIGTWMEICLREHEACSEDSISRLPTRVLDVGSEDSDPFLFESKGAFGTWIALSYCWGDAAPFKSTSVNIEDRCRNISFEALPLLFQDAIRITRRLGYKYLWIDSLCIVQDSKEDWLKESSSMGYIFQRSVLTIAAEAAMNSSFGLFQTTNEERYTGIFLPSHSEKLNFKGAICITPENLHDPDFSKGPLSRRAWTLQENILSRRVLHFARVQVWWECRKKIFPEIDPEGIRPFPSWNYDTAGPLTWPIVSKFDQWLELMNGFSKRRITFDEDTFPSITGMAKEFRASLGNSIESYQAELWLQDIHRSLLWSAYAPGARKRTCYVAPSWSWASINFTECSKSRTDESLYGKRAIYHNRLMDQPTYKGWLPPNYVAEIQKIQISNADGDPFGQVTSGYLRVYAPCSDICSCNIPPCFWTAMKDALQTRLAAWK